MIKKVNNISWQFLLMAILTVVSMSNIYSQKIIKIGVLYTSKAESAIGFQSIEQKAKNQISIIEDILSNSGIDDLKLEVSYTKLHKYEEPKHRNNGYIRFSFDGTYQILDEISNHAGLMDYFISNDVNSFDENGVNYIDQDELSQSLISLNAITKLNVVLFIADEDGPPNISEYFPQDLTSHTSRTFFSIINAEAFSKIDVSLALGFFGIFTDEDNADFDEDEKPSSSSFMSFWEYDDIDVQRILSDENIDLFRCNVSKLNLTSPDKMEVGGVFINSETQNSITDVQSSMAIVPSSPVNKRNFSVIAPEGDDYSLALVTKRQRSNYPICISEKRSNKLYYIEPKLAVNKENEYDKEIKVEFDNESLFATNKVKVYPNPTDGVVTFDFVLSMAGDYKLALYNSYGSQVMMSSHNLKRGFNRIIMDYGRIDSGIYIYRLVSDVEQQISGKLILK